VTLHILLRQIHARTRKSASTQGLEDHFVFPCELRTFHVRSGISFGANSVDISRMHCAWRRLESVSWVIAGARGCVCELSVQRLLPYQDLGSSRKSATSISKQTSHCMTRVQTIISFRSTDIGQYCCYLDYYLYTIFPLRLRSSPSTPMQLPNILHDHNILYNISPTKTLRTSATHHTFLPNRSNEPTRSTLHI
jgi:hypothetical protein